MVPGSNPGGDKIFFACPVRYQCPPGLMYNGYHVHPAGGAARAWCWPLTLF